MGLRDLNSVPTPSPANSANFAVCPTVLSDSYIPVLAAQVRLSHFWSPYPLPDSRPSALLNLLIDKPSSFIPRCSPAPSFSSSPSSRSSRPPRSTPVRHGLSRFLTLGMLTLTSCRSLFAAPTREIASRQLGTIGCEFARLGVSAGLSTLKGILTTVEGQVTE